VLFSGVLLLLLQLLLCDRLSLLSSRLALSLSLLSTTPFDERNAAGFDGVREKDYM
jgi:hypothetical protein